MRTRLPDVTLVAATSVALGPTLDALHASMREIDFGQVLLLSHEPPKSDGDGKIEWRQIDPLLSRKAYSEFMFRGLAPHIHTTHALCIQWDGFVLHGERWNPAFLDYDYIGAPWPHFSDGHNVGNGGFSLRSARLLKACTDLAFDGTEAEDVVISRWFRSQLEEEGICFAPEAVAREFSYERMKPTGRELGFHGAFNLVSLLSSKDATRLFRELEPMVLARSEHWELLRWAIAHGRVALAAVLGRRLLGSHVTG